MKLFLIGFGHARREQVDVARELKKQHEIRYWVRMNSVFKIDESEFPETVFHDYHHAIKGIPAPRIDARKFMPPSAALITDLVAYESELMTMMTKWYPEWNVIQRKHFYYELLRYWSGVLDVQKPDTIVFLEIPHEIYSFVVFALAKHRGIRTLMFENILRYDRLIPYEDYRIGNAGMLHAQKEGYPNKTRVEELSPSTREHYLEQTGGKDKTPDYVDTFIRAYRGRDYWIRQFKSLAPFVKDGSVFERAAARFFKFFRSNLKKEYARVVRSPDLEKPFVYLGLHLQPERTTSPQAGIYVDQLLIIKTLAAALPGGWELYVKEHPTQSVRSRGDYTQYRYKGYYTQIAALPNVRLIPTETDSFQLIRKARAVATATGTLGWEALLRGVPAVVFGYAWYGQAPGVFRVASVAECKEAFARIGSGLRLDAQEMLNYLGYLERASFASYLDEYARQLSRITAEESSRNMYEAIQKALDRGLFRHRPL